MGLAGPATADPVVRPSVADSFRLGVGGDTLCQVQRAATDPVTPGLFDRAYALVCRDAAAPVGRLYVARANGVDLAARLAQRREGAPACTDLENATVDGIGAVAVRRCSGSDGLARDTLIVTRGRVSYAAEGLSGYRSALDLGLRSLVLDRVVDGPIAIATTQAGDAASFARAQAGSLDPALALTEGYRRNNSGSYAEAAEFFDTLLQRTAAADRRSLGEYLINRALQQSDLGMTDEANALFAEALRTPTADPVEQRLRRNYLALHLLNQRRFEDAMRALDMPIEPAAAPGAGSAEIDIETATALEDRSALATSLAPGEAAELTPGEKAALLDAQATALRGAILRLQRRPAEAARTFDAALAGLDRIRGGRIASLARLRAEVLTEQAALAESAGRAAASRTLLADAATLLANEYPDSVVLDAAEARVAAFDARHGRADEALATYRRVAASLGARGGASVGFADLLEPYFTLLAARVDAQPALADDLFAATQALLRPGVADTQAVLARELSGGDGEAARLFRQSLNEARSATALRLEAGRLAALPAPTDGDRAALAADRARLTDLETEQSATQARLAAFPAYRAIATQALSLADLRAALRPGEGYWKLTVVGRSIYALLVTSAGTRAWRLPIGPAELARRVDAIRDTIVRVENGAPATYPFDVSAARALYRDLAGPAAAELPTLKHLIVEPDGAMQRLPPGLLIVDGPGVDRYLARARQPGADPFDVTGIDWLAARTGISISLSARAFRDVRAAAPSTAPRAYLGFGQNAPVAPFLQLTAYTPPASAIDCRWPLAAWSRPVSAAELFAARDAAGAGNGAVVTGAAFSDDAILARGDLARYRVVHFATHGLVTAPRPECPATPALLTSFGGRGSDGLLSFGEVYGLRLDADLVVLSACDTAGAADIAATRAAGVGTGGGNALDGLVRAFIGAGARAVLATHWPAPDDYRATGRLIEGLFTAPAGASVAEAIRRAQLQLMAAPVTSHPYYWAGFALVGDGAKPLLRAP